MAAVYPGSIRAFTTHVDLTETVFALHMNDAQDEIMAIQNTLGTNPQGAATSPATVGNRIAILEGGSLHAKSDTTHTHDSGSWVGLTVTNHDVDTRHTFGAALGTPVLPAAWTAGSAGAAGTGVHPAREDHAHPTPTAASLASTVLPAGTIVAYGGATAPTGWVLCDGTSYLRGTTSADTYYNLFQAIGTAYGSVDGTHFTVPDLRQRMPLGKAASGTGSTLGGSGGSKDAVVASHGHAGSTVTAGNADHTHYVDHTHGVGTAFQSHSHDIYHGHYAVVADNSNANDIQGWPANNVHRVFRSSDRAPGNTLGGGTLFNDGSFAHPFSGGTATDHDHGNTGTMNGRTATDGASGAANHGHGLTIALAGVSATDANLPPYVVVNYIIKL